MTTRTVAALVAAVVLLGAVAPALALPALESPTATTDVAVQTNNTTNESASLGASVSGFMQTSAASAEGEVDNGVFRASFANASNETKRAMVDRRTAALEQRLDRLRAQRNALLNGSDNLTVAERAKAARLTAEIDELKRAINTTDDAAAEVGVNATRLERLRTEADELDGPEVAELARGLAGQGDRGPPETRGQSEDRGPKDDNDTNETDGDDDVPDDDSDDDRGNGNSPPGDDTAGDDATTATETDEPDDTDADDDDGDDAFASAPAAPGPSAGESPSRTDSAVEATSGSTGSSATESVVAVGSSGACADSGASEGSSAGGRCG